MTVSVIVPAYNEIKFMEKCLSSIRGQTIKGLELIVVDDGSTDGTLEIAEKYADRVIRQSHMGSGKARNAGAKEAKGEILVFIDADMFLADDCLEKIIKPIERGEAGGTCIVDEFVANKENKWSMLWSIAHSLPYDRRLPEGLKDADAFRAIRREPFLSSGGYREERAAGQDKIADRVGFRAIAVPGAVAYHNNPDTFARCMKDAKKFGKGSIHFFKGWGIALFLLKYSVFRSVPVGFARAFQRKKPSFILFKIALDWMILSGFVEALFTRDTKE